MIGQELLVLACLPEPFTERLPSPPPRTNGPPPLPHRRLAGAPHILTCWLSNHRKAGELPSQQRTLSGSVIVEAPRPRWSVPRPAGMASKGGEEACGLEGGVF